VIVPGNHDHHLLAAWFERRARRGPPPALGLESAVDWQPGEPLAELAGWLAPAEVRVSYPGVWLRPDVYAIHGHYADLHLTMPTIERLAAGVMGRIVGCPPRARAPPRSTRRHWPRCTPGFTPSPSASPRSSGGGCTEVRSGGGARSPAPAAAASAGEPWRPDFRL